MTICYTVERFPVLSQTFISNEIAHLRRLGEDVVVAMLWEGDDAIDTDVPTLIARAPHSGRRRLLAAHLRYAVPHPLRYLKFLRVVHGLGPEAKLIAWRRLPGVALALRARGVDRLHAHFAWGGAALAMALSSLTGWPWALTVHARDIFSDRRNLDRKLSDTDLLITVCDYNLRFLREQLDLRREVAIVICGVDVPERGATARIRDLDIVFIGRLVAKKGVDVLLRALATTATGHAEARLHVIGDGEERGALTDLANSLGVADRVTFHGALPHPETLDLLDRARVFCLPARVAEDGDVDSMPLVIKEAMARSVAVVASDAGGVKEMIDANTGLLVPPDDPEQLSRALDQVLGDEALRARLAQAGRSRVEREFTLDGEVAKLQTLLARMGRG